MSDFELDFETIAKLKQAAIDKQKAEAHVVDGEIVEVEEDSGE